MHKQLQQIKCLILTALVFFLGTAVQAQDRGYGVTDRQVQVVLNRIETRTNDLRDQIARNGNTGMIDQSGNSIDITLSNFQSSTDRLRDDLGMHRSTAADVQDVLDKAAFVNAFMRNNRMSVTSQNVWTDIRRDLNTLAGYYQLRPAWNDSAILPPVQTGGYAGGYAGGYTVSDVQMRNLLYRLQRRSSAFRLSFNTWNNSYYRRRQIGSTGDMVQNIADFERALNSLTQNYTNRSTADVDDLLRSASLINSYIAANRTNVDVSNKWNLVREDLGTLAGYYRINWDYAANVPAAPVNQIGRFDTRLTGTYRLNTAQSDVISNVVDQAIIRTQYDPTEQDRVRRRLERRLTAPDTLVIEKTGAQVTIGSSTAQPVTLTANGVAQTETSPSGRTVRTSVTASDRDLAINYQGDMNNDYNVTFMPIGNGQLRVTRRLSLGDQNQTVTAVSVYDKTSPAAVFNNTIVYPSPVAGGPVNAFLIPNNTSIIATLDTPLSTRTARNGDRFSMTVTSPYQFTGAVIEGTVVGQPSGVVSGRANMNLAFDTIRTREGRTYRFAGIVDQVRTLSGDTVTVNNEGAIRDTSQTNKTVERAGVGALLGAIIGAIAGGGEGAAIGATVGAGAGAGSVVLQGRDNLELPTGSTFMITATAPAGTP